MKRIVSAILGLGSGLVFGYFMVGFLQILMHETLPLEWTVIGIIAFFGLAGLGIGVMSLRSIIVGDAILVGFGIFSLATHRPLSLQIFFNNLIGEAVFALSVVGFLVALTTSRGKPSQNMKPSKNYK